MSFIDNTDRLAAVPAQPSMPMPATSPVASPDSSLANHILKVADHKGIDLSNIDFPTPRKSQLITPFTPHQIVPVEAARPLLELDGDNADDRASRVRFSGFDEVRLTFEYRDAEHSFALCQDRQHAEKSYSLPPLDRTPTGPNREMAAFMQCALQASLGMEADKAYRILNSLAVIIGPLREGEQIFDAVRTGLASMKGGKSEPLRKILHYGGFPPASMQELRIIARATLMAMVFQNATQEELLAARQKLDAAMAETPAASDGQQKPVAVFIQFATAILKAFMNDEDIEDVAIPSAPLKSCLKAGSRDLAASIGERGEDVIRIDLMYDDENEYSISIE